MQCEMNRRVVQEGLRRRADRRAETERSLEAYEVDMIRFCNDRHAMALMDERVDADVRMCRQQSNARIAKRAKIRALKQERRKDTVLDCLTYFVVTVLLFWLTAWTYLPVWCAVTTAIGLFSLLMADIYLIHNQ